ncbi:MAG: tetratricopeptide repeat protein [Fimbriimonadaceae bacterium]|nr:tetratricopeptide repeat protein [Fimbriimonadaceae bacterium]
MNESSGESAPFHGESGAETLGAARQKIRDRDFSAAAELLADDLVPQDASARAEWLNLRGVALAELGRYDDAEADMRVAIELNPTAKHQGNLAALLMLRDRPFLAIELAKKALDLDPDEPSAQSVLDRAYSPGLTVSTMAGSEPYWTWLGYAAIALGLIVTCLLVVHPPVTLPEFGKPNAFDSTKPRNDALSVLGFYLWITSGLLCGSWLLIDVIFRRQRFTWLVPQVIFCFCGLTWVPTAIYFLIARKTDVK